MRLCSRYCFRWVSKMTETAKIWVVDDDRSIRWVLERALGQAGMDVSTFESANEVLRRLERAEPDALISDVRMPGLDGMSLLRDISARKPHLPVIIMTAYSDLDSAVSAYQGGAFDYLPKPFDVDEAVDLVRRAVQERAGDGQAPEPAAPTDRDIIGSAAAMQEVSYIAVNSGLLHDAAVERLPTMPKLQELWAPDSVISDRGKGRSV